MKAQYETTIAELKNQLEQARQSDAQAQAQCAEQKTKIEELTAQLTQLTGVVDEDKSGIKRKYIDAQLHITELQKQLTEYIVRTQSSE